MSVIYRNRKFRKTVSALLASMMVITMMPFTAFATIATPSTATLTDAGTTGLARVIGQANNGLNGEISVTVTGTVATRADYRGLTVGRAATVGDLNDFVLDRDLQPELWIGYTDHNGVSTETTITGLTRASTVAQVMDAIDTQLATATAGFDSMGRLMITADQMGSATDIWGWGSLWNALFDHELPGVLGFTAGREYTNFEAVVDFRPVDGTSYRVGSIPAFSADMGIIRTDGTFVADRHSRTGAYTAIRLSPGFDVLLGTAGDEGISLTPGVARITLGSGARTDAPPSVRSVDPNRATAGSTTTFTVTIDPPTSEEATAVVDRVRLALPAGFRFGAGAGAVIPAGSMAASVSVDASAGIVTVSNFRLADVEVAEAGRPLAVEVGGVIVPNRVATGLAFGVDYRNIGSVNFLPLVYTATDVNSIAVESENNVARIDLTATGNRAGGISVVGARLFDRFDNPIEGPGRDRMVDFTVAGPVHDRLSTLAQASVGPQPTHDLYGFRNEVTLSTTEGLTTVTASVVATVGGSTRTTATVTLDTRGVGAPNRLVLTDEGGPFVVGEDAWFRLGLVDANGKATSFLGDAGGRQYRVFHGQGGSDWSTELITNGFSETAFTMTSDEPGTWDMWAVDIARGAVFESGVIRPVWGALPAPPGEYVALSVAAETRVLERNVTGYSIRNTGNFGYSPANGTSPVTFTVTTVDVNGDPVARPGITIRAQDLDDPNGRIPRPGVITPESSVTNSSGVAVFTVTSTVPSRRQGDGSFPFNEWRFTDVADDEIWASGYANHFAPIVNELTVDRRVARADGTDAITVTAMMTDPFAFAPVAGASVFFSPGEGVRPTLSSTQGTSDAQGRASITVVSSEAGSSEIGARDLVGGSQEWVEFNFTNFVARPLQSMITAQQSDRGPLADVDWVIEDLQGNRISFDEVDDLIVWGDGVAGGREMDDADSTIVTEIRGNWDLVAGDSIRAIVDGFITIAGRHGTNEEYFVGDVGIAVVNNAGVQLNWIDASDGAFRSRFTVTGSGFRRSGDEHDWVEVEHKNTRGQWVSAGEAVVDGSGYLVPDYSTGTDRDQGIRRDIIRPLHLGASLPAGTYDVRIDGLVFEDLLRIGAADAQRISGADRYLTAVELSAANFARATSVVIASGENYPDALTASSLAGSLEAPVLLTRQGSVPAAVLAEITRLGANKAYIIGGTGALSPAVATALQGAGLQVERIAGADRYATAVAVADKVVTIEGPDWNREVFVASGENFPDALAAAPISAAKGMPILLTRQNALPAATARFLADRAVTRSHVVGGTGVIGTWIQTAAPGANRLAGANRYATAVEVAEFAQSMGMNYGYLGLASGANYPDALAGGVVVGRNNGILLLTHPNTLSPETAAAILENDPSRVEVFGGPGAISASVIEELEALF